MMSSRRNWNCARPTVLRSRNCTASWLQLPRLKELGSEAVPPPPPASSEVSRQGDYRQWCQRREFRKYVTELPRRSPWQSG